MKQYAGSRTTNSARHKKPSMRENPSPRQTSRPEATEATSSMGTAPNVMTGRTAMGRISTAIPRMAAMLKMFEP